LLYSIARETQRRWPGLVKRAGISDDLAHEAIGGLLYAARTFDPERGVKFSTLAGLAIRHAITNVLGRSRYRLRVDQLEGLGFGQDEAENRERHVALAAAIARLEPRKRQLVVEHYLDGRKLCDVSADLGILRQSCQQLKTRALSVLRGELERVGIAEP
jgi:RNA polymerase sigma factor (sigma-70 family)